MGWGGADRGGGGGGGGSHQWGIEPLEWRQGGRRESDTAGAKVTMTVTSPPPIYIMWMCS